MGELPELGQNVWMCEEVDEFTKLCLRNVSVFLMGQKPKYLKELDQMAKQYLNAHNKKLSMNISVVRQDVKDTKFMKFRGHRNIMKGFVCDGRGHKAVDSFSKASTSQNGHFCWGYYYKCG